MSRELVAEWFQACAIRKDTYTEALSGDFDEDEFLGYMVQGFAMAVAQLSAPGVFVAMNGQIFSWDEVRKNRATGVFERH